MKLMLILIRAQHDIVEYIKESMDYIFQNIEILNERKCYLKKKKTLNEMFVQEHYEVERYDST